MDYVISTKTKMKLPYIEFVNMSDEMYIKSFSNNVPAVPYKDPVIDRLACYLYNNSGILKRLIHHIKSYGCCDPTYIDGKKIYVTSFSYEKEMRMFMDTVLDNEHKTVFIKNWRRNIGLAVAKLSGQVYMSAGAD